MESKNGTKIFYSVRYRTWGADAPMLAWFASKEEAEEFSRYDYRDDPVIHRVSRPEKIEKFERLVALTAIGMD